MTTLIARIIAALLISAMSLPGMAGESQVNEDSRVASSPSSSKPAAPASRWHLGIALGYGLRTNPLVQSDDIPIIVDIDISWFGDRFFFDNGDLGYTFLDNAYVTTSLVGRINSDRVFFGRTNTRFVTVDLAGAPLASAFELSIPDRDYAGELGIELLADGGWGRLQLTGFHDVSGTHEGYEFEFDYGYGWRNQRLYIEPSFGLSYKSEEMNNYYWGVPADETNIAVPGYTADAGVNAHARLQVSYQLSKNWQFSFVGEVERMNDEAAGSPIVAEQNVFGYFAGFGYRFN